MLNRIPLLHVTQPSYVTFSVESAQLLAGQSRGTQDNAPYLDDFEGSETTIDVSQPISWIISSVSLGSPEYSDRVGLRSSFNRSFLAWRTIDPLFTRRSNLLIPGYIKSDLKQLSNRYVREIPVGELFPVRDRNYSGSTSTSNILDFVYYPSKRGPYNFSPNVNVNGHLMDPTGT